MRSISIIKNATDSNPCATRPSIYANSLQPRTSINSNQTTTQARKVIKNANSHAKNMLHFSYCHVFNTFTHSLLCRGSVLQLFAPIIFHSHTYHGSVAVLRGGTGSPFINLTCIASNRGTLMCTSAAVLKYSTFSASELFECRQAASVPTQPSNGAYL